MVPELGLQLQILEAGMIPKQETVTVFKSCQNSQGPNEMGYASITSGKIGINSEYNYTAWW